MNFVSKILAGVLAAALVVTTTIVPASATTQNKNSGAGVILPAIAGPIGAAAIVGTTSQHLLSKTFVKYFKFYKGDYWGWKKVYYLKKTGWDVDLYKHGHKVKVHAEKTKHKYGRSNSTQGKFVVGCIMGSALGAITAAIRKGNAMGNPLRWRSQAEHEAIVKSGYEKQFELTNEEAGIAVALCGLGSLTLNWQQQAPAVVKARY